MYSELTVGYSVLLFVLLWVAAAWVWCK